MEELTQEIVQELLDYNPETGILTWKERSKEWFKRERDWKPWNIRFAGKEAGHDWKGSKGRKASTSYRQISIFSIIYPAHRVAWMYYHGYWPNVIDHINGNGLDNRITNLRDVSYQENSKNMAKFCNNTSGVTGVCWCNTHEKWIARINVRGKKITLGYFENFDEAVEARKSAEVEYGYHENHGRDNQ